MEDEVRICSQ